MGYKIRVKEVAIYEDGTNIWYYPEAANIPRYPTKIVDKLWWKKEVPIELKWEVFYKNDLDITRACYSEDKFSKKKYLVGFRKKEDAELWVKEWLETQTKKDKKSHEDFWKYYASKESKDIKIHEIK